MNWLAGWAQGFGMVLVGLMFGGGLIYLGERHKNAFVWVILGIFLVGFVVLLPLAIACGPLGYCE